MARKRINNINNYFALLKKVATNNEENRSFALLVEQIINLTIS